MKRSTVVWVALAVAMLALILCVSRSKTAAPEKPNIIAELSAVEATLSNGVVQADAIEKQLAVATPTNIVVLGANPSLSQKQQFSPPPGTVAITNGEAQLQELLASRRTNVSR